MREPLRFSWRHWWNLVLALLVAAGVTLWRLDLIDGRLVLLAALVWLGIGGLAAPSLMYEHLGFLDRHLFHDYSKARMRYRKAVEARKATPQGMCALASLCFAEGDTAEAIRLLEEAVIKRPDDPHLLALLSRALSRAGRHEEAVAAALRCRTMKGEQPLYDMILAHALLAKGETLGAASAYQRAVKAKPALAGPHIGLAGTYFAMGEVDAAGREAREALAAAPKDPDALYWAGKVAEAKGDAGAAREYYRSALEARPMADRNVEIPYQELIGSVSRVTSGEHTSDPGSLGKHVG